VQSRSDSLSSSDVTERKVTVTNSAKEEDIAEYLREVTSKDPDQAYVAEWKFFLEGKGRVHCDGDLIRCCNFAVKFMDKWQDVRITLEVRYPPSHPAPIPTLSNCRSTASAAFSSDTFTKLSSETQVGSCLFTESPLSSDKLVLEPKIRTIWWFLTSTKAKRPVPMVCYNSCRMPRLDEC